MELLVTTIGSALSILLPIPQAKRAYFVSTNGVSLHSYVGFLSVAVIWVPHGIFNDIPMLSISHAISACLTMTIIFSIVRDSKSKKTFIYSLVVVL